MDRASRVQVTRRPAQPAMKKRNLKQLLKLLENPTFKLLVGSTAASVVITRREASLFIGRRTGKGTIRMLSWPIKTAMRAINLGLVTEDKSFPRGLCYKGIPY